MTMPRVFRSVFLAFGVVLAALPVTACGRASDREAAATAPAATPSPTAGVAYEPAYPAEVSTDGLQQQDVEQQEKPHSHDGGEPHTHDEGKKDDEGDHGHPH